MENVRNEKGMENEQNEKGMKNKPNEKKMKNEPNEKKVKIESELNESGQREKETVSPFSWISSLFIALSLYSRIPVPQTEWTEKAMGYALCFFPLVGVVVGAVMTGFIWLSKVVGLGGPARACLGTAIPLLLTGGIHMDGFLDTVDARSSCQTRERKLEILKDPHTGAFALIGGGIYLLVSVAVFSELPNRAFPAAAGIYILSRALSGWSVVSFPKAKKDGLVSTFSSVAQKRAVQVSMAVWGVLAVGILLFGGLLPVGADVGQAAAGSILAVGTAMTGGIVAAGFFSLAGGCLVFLYYRRMSLREFGGVTGDLAGYFLQLCELVMLAALAIGIRCLS